ncbi:hypothetical protein PRZ48_014563 [Zasmidium cellare]|uniref:Carrier domain-containing protein n=1 Tax=Zasmidium cellare TaxID=395010 RepID=A0ABR0DYM1_ZASCE|nr:hypothetical protein PRZ48_014563 [Zasmidium cellare]
MSSIAAESTHTTGVEDLPDLPLPTFIDAVADRDPDRVFAEVLTAANGKYSSRLITLSQLANAADEAARWLDEQFGKDALPRTIAVMAPASDVRYLFYLLGAVKSERLAFFPSPRNDIEAHCSLFEEYQCSTLLLPRKSPFYDTMRPVIERLGLNVVEIPGLHFFLSGTVKPYPWTPSVETDFRLEPLVGLHTSGSTGIPKPVLLKHGNATAMQHWRRIPELGHGNIHFTYWEDKTILVGLPLFHAAALNIVISALQNNIFVVFPPAIPGPLSADIVGNILEHANIDVLVTSPSILADMASDLKLLKTFSQVGAVAYGGGPLPRVAGDLITRQCHLLNFIGMSETGILPCELVRQQDWQYVKFSPMLGIEMRPYADGLYELYFVRNEAYKDFQVPFFTFPELDEYTTKDLFSQHPTKPDLWMWQGRTDDIIVYSTGEKFNPTSMEDALNGNPSVKTALVCGDGRAHSALLVEPQSVPGDSISSTDVIDRIWPHIKQVNSTSLQHGRILKEMILVTDPDRPLPRAGKGTVQRKAALSLYESDLEALYSAEPRGSSRRSDSVMQSEDLDEQLLTQQILDILERSSGMRLQPADDFFAAGLDSMGVTAILRSLRKLVMFHGDQRPLDAKMIYDFPSAASLARYLSGGEPEVDQYHIMEELFEKYSSDMPITAREPLPIDEKRKVVIITGSTGSFGTYLLDTLLRDETVAHVICLNRKENAEKIQLRSLSAKGLSTDLRGTTLTFATADFSKQYLGLDTLLYKDLLKDVTHIIHNAWEVNFNLPVQHFERPHICGVRQLVDFSARSTHGAVIMFISSIGAVSAYDPPDSDEVERTVIETVVEDWSAASAESGYGQSKLVSERILATAAQEASVPCAIVRVGQIAGPVSGNGRWQKHEWLPSLVVSSKYLGVLPATLGSFDVVDWIPIDLAANIIGEFMRNVSTRLKDSPDQALVYHAVNPKKTTWDALLPSMQPYLGVWKVVPSYEWVNLLSESEDKASAENPAGKLLAFYKGLVESDMQVPLDTTESERASPTLASLEAISGEMFGKWLRKWV